LVTSKQPRRRNASGRKASGRKASGRKPSPDIDYQALAQFRYELRRFQAFSGAAAIDAGLTTQQHQALLAIRGFSSDAPVSVGDLAKLLLVRHHTAVELTNRMVKLRLVGRIVDEADARRVFVKLTSEGERRLQKLSRVHIEELRSVGPALTRMLRQFRRR
jgi:DNA-binding MarR family transcriptional regulator